MTKLYKIYRNTYNKQVCIARNVKAEDIGLFIVDDVSRYLDKHLNKKSFGRNVAKDMTLESIDDFEVDVEYFGIPTHTVREQKVST